VSTIIVPRQKDCAIINCHGPPSEGSRVSSFILERIHGLDANRRNIDRCIVDKLVIDDSDTVNSTSQKPAKSVSQHDSKMYLRLLMQLLAPDTNIQCNAQTIMTTFKSIQALTDLGEGLDAISKCTRMEKDMSIDGSTLLSQAISYCRSRLKQAKEIESQEGSGAVRRAAIVEMTSRIAYFDRLVQAYEILSRYELKNGLDKNEMDDDIRVKDDLSHWESEALYWTSATSSLNADNNSIPVLDVNINKPLAFSTVCSFRMVTFFQDSTANISSLYIVASSFQFHVNRMEVGKCI
jgi:hypothetical protein